MEEKFLSPQNFGKFYIKLPPLPPFPPIVMIEGAETMSNQITFIFSKEWNGTILSMHLTKFHKSEKWKKKKNETVKSAQTLHLPL